MLLWLESTLLLLLLPPAAAAQLLAAFLLLLLSWFILFSLLLQILLRIFVGSDGVVVWADPCCSAAITLPPIMLLPLADYFLP